MFDKYSTSVLISHRDIIDADLFIHLTVKRNGVMPGVVAVVIIV
jgi:hypothetical protein